MSTPAPEPLPENVKAEHRRKMAKMAADPSVTLFKRDREVTQSVDVIGATKETEVQSVGVLQSDASVVVEASALEGANCTNNLTKTHSMLTDTIPNHPLSEMFPILDGEAQQQLVEDIRANGLIHPIIVFDGKILDGRNRYHACLDANIEPKFVTYDRDDPVSYVISQNLHRRHLGPSQRAMIAAKIANMRQGERTDLEPSLKLGEVKNPSISKGEAAKLLKVGESTVDVAKQVQRDAIPEVIQAVETNELPVNRAAAIAKLPVERQAEALSESPKRGRRVMIRNHAKGKMKKEDRLPPLVPDAYVNEMMIHKELVKFWERLLSKAPYDDNKRYAAVIVKYLNEFIAPTDSPLTRSNV